jgi:MFS family permease
MDDRGRIRAIVAASSGNLVEWFDFYIYAFMSLYFAHAFFPSGNPTTQLLNTAGVFAAGSPVRPIGGWMFGRIADKRGRKAAMLISVFMMCGGSLSFYTFTSYMQKYLVNTASMDARTASLVMTCALFVTMLMQPLFGALSDRVGRRASMRWFGGSATLCTVPILHALASVRSPYAAFTLVVGALAIISFYSSISGLIKSEMFPAEVRALGVGFSHALGSAIFGGSAEYVALWLKSAGHEAGFYWYVTAMCAIAFVVCLKMRDPARVGYLKDAA